MAESIDTIFATLEARAWSFHGLVDKDTNHHLVPHVQRAYASVSTCAALLLEVKGAAEKYAAAKARPNQSTANQTADAVTLGSFAVAYMGFESLLESADLFSKGQDVEIIKQLGWRTVTVGAQLLAKFSGISYVKDAAEIAAAFQEAVSTGRILRLRKSQARMATDLLNWIDGVTTIGLAWSFAAQLFLLGAAGQGDVSDESVSELVLQRMAARSQTWHPSTTH
jgi:hypothetical protein